MTAAIGLERRFANFRAGLAARPAVASASARNSTSIGAERLAATLDGELVRTSSGSFVRIEAPSTLLPVEQVDDVVVVLPEYCRHCGQPFPDTPARRRAQVWRHQVVELLPLAVQVQGSIEKPATGAT